MFGRPIKRFYSLICINLNRPKAEAQGNGEAAARYRQAVSLQRQIYRERAEQEEQAEKVRAETRRPALPPPSRPCRRKSASRCPTCNA